LNELWLRVIQYWPPDLLPDNKSVPMEGPNASNRIHVDLDQTFKTEQRRAYKRPPSAATA
jgi:hypothetical protein